MAASVATARRNPAWSRDELILALDLYFKLTVSEIHAANEKVIALSELLNRLPSRAEADVATYRNPNGVAMKLHNFARFDPTRSSSLKHGQQLEEEIWNEFAGARAELAEEAARVAAKAR